MATRKKKTNSTIYLVGGVAAAGLLYFMRKPNAKAQAIAIITASGKVKDPASLQTMDENYLTAWAYAINAKTLYFPALGLATDGKAVVIGKYSTNTGIRSGYAKLDIPGQVKILIVNAAANYLDANQKAFAMQLVQSARAKQGLPALVIT